ncbi:MAG: hypothetical protein IJK98_01095, partial [Clostridia bacterium]|nr:hypothetical protein [Clostridia bacterium]
MKKRTLAFVLIFALTLGNCALFRYSFQEWIVPLYAVSVAVFALLAFAVCFLLAKAKNKTRPVLRGLLAAAVYAAAAQGLTYAINNLLYNGKHPHAAVAVVSFGTVLFFSVAAVWAVCAAEEKKLPAVLTGAVSLTLCFCLTVIPLIRNPVPLSKAQQYALQPTPTGFGVYTKKERTLLTEADLYVSPNGSDDNDGSFDKPLATVEKARDLVRVMDKTGKDGITVALLAGEYRVSSVTFTAEDGGTESCPVAYAAYGDGEVVFNGGVTLSPEAFGPVADEAVLPRFTADAREKIVCADLSALGVTRADYGKLYAIGSYNTANKYTGDWTGELACELFFNDVRCTTARWPDSGEWLTTGKVIRTGEGKESNGNATRNKNWDALTDPTPDIYEVERDVAARIESWQTLDNVWLFGYWKYDWADASTPIESY